jgi:predicted amidohydrolase
MCPPVPLVIRLNRHILPFMTAPLDTGVPGNGGSPATGTATVAVAQFAPVHGDVPANLAVVRALLEQAASSRAGLVVFPELATTGYAWASADEVGPLAEPVPGPVTDRLTGWCREFGCHLVIGLVERAGRVLYNTAVLTGPQGLVGRYRKTKLWSWDTLWATAGAQPPAVWPTPAGRVGILICADLDYPEGTSWLARVGADLIAAPVCWSDDPTPSPVWRTRAHDSAVPFAVANISGTEWGTTFSAGSCVIDADGSLLGRATEPQQLIVATVDLTAGMRRRAARAGGALDERPEAFEALNRNPQLFARSELPGPVARPRTAAPARVAVVQGRGDGPAEAALTELAGRLPAPVPVVAVLPALLAADLAADPGLPARLARLCQRYGPTEFVVSVLDERSGQTTVLLAAGGAVVTSVTVSPGGVRTGDGAPLRPVARPWGAVGLLTAAELLRPEPMRCLAVNGSDLIAATGRLASPPAETAAADGVPPFDLWRVRAGENNCYLAVANATRPDGSGGRSALHGPSHYDWQAARVTLDARAEDAASLPLILDPATPAGRMAADKPLLAQRRPELYAGRLAS